MNTLLYFWLFLKASLFSTGGFGNVPSLHSDLTARGWATDRQFAESLTIGQISPGPNGLWVISLGYLTKGVLGSILALIAITLPPLLILLVQRAYQRVEDHPAVAGFMRGLSLAVVGIFTIVLAGILHTSGLDIRSIAIAVCAILLAWSRKIPIVAIIALAGLAGVL
ncbi:MAG TPA: chromate transporter [Capsulimonadaceae bacterium]|nr:chromate transporter [Capsulimonadaceae bacterium]